MGPTAGNATEAAKRAGYAARSAAVTGSQLLRKPKIRKAVEAARAKLSKATIADATERREILSTLLRADKVNGLIRIKAADTLNKMDGLYVKKLANPDGSPLRLTSDAELDARIAILESQVKG